MSGVAALDLRYPIGGLFTVLGLLLAGYGFVTRADATMYQRSQGVNINLWWGLVLLATGFVFLALARRGGRGGGMRPAETTPEGQATEAREKALGLERP